MEFIDEQNDSALGFFDLFQYGFQPLFKFATVFGSGDESTHVQREDGLVFQSFGNVASYDSLGESLRNGSLTDAWFTDKDRIVFCLAGEDPDDVPYFGITPDHRVHLIFPRPFHQIRSVFCQGIVSSFRIVTGHRTASNLGKLADKSVFCNSVIGKDLFDLRGVIREDTDHDMFHGQIFVPHALCGFFCRFQNTVSFR